MKPTLFLLSLPSMSLTKRFEVFQKDVLLRLRGKSTLRLLHWQPQTVVGTPALAWTTLAPLPVQTFTYQWMVRHQVHAHLQRLYHKGGEVSETAPSCPSCSNNTKLLVVFSFFRHTANWAFCCKGCQFLSASLRLYVPLWGSLVLRALCLLGCFSKEMCACPFFS